jgi:hypothetical protein
MCILNGIQTWHIDAILHIFSRKSKRASPISMHPRGATNVCVNMYYVMHMTRESQQLKQENHMSCLPKSNSLVWQTGQSDSDFAR